ncbi:Exocyst complex protein exo70 [Teratosphaeria destructans]|uniref:Exocyst complex protein EXO70 n=1 Tax=Teratosphaeria destructans TaxID=418781 RepID=A0A9W7SHQ3_9PEZI|nr:Exocyst complex protein exo70 [Teratosphaeria destructans]
MVAPSKRAAYAEEAAEVEVLSANVDKLKSIRKRIGGSLERLEQSGRVMQEAMGPVYGNTQRLQTMSTNVDNILAAIDRIKQPLNMRDREDRIIRSRPDKVGLQEYMASIDRTSEALRNLQATNLRSNQQAMVELNDLLATGVNNLANVFRDVLRQDSQPIEPLKQIMGGAEFPRILSNKSTQLRAINQHISNHASEAVQQGKLSPSAEAYAHERGQYIQLSLQNLARASINTARKVSASDVYTKGSNGIASYAAGIQGMYTAEYDSICAIFKRDEWGVVLQATCQPSLQAFAQTLKDLDKHVRENLFTDCYLAYEIIELVSTTSIQLESKTGELKYAMSDALKPVRETAKGSLSVLLNDIRVKIQQMQTLPMDGAAVPITADVMTRLQLMTGYLPPLSSIMRSLGDGGWNAPKQGNSASSIPTLKSFDVGADGKQLFAHYCSDTIETLLNNLESRARVLLRGKSVQGVFLANNVTIVERMIRSSELGPLLDGVSPRLEAFQKKAISLYMDAWREPSTHLFDVQFTSKAPRPPSTGAAIDSAAVLKALNSKDKDGIKEKFKNFNMSFDELVARHKSYKMESEVRKLLSGEVQRSLEPLYNRFWDRYHEVDKGKGKYVKYDKAQMNRELVNLS